MKKIYQVMFLSSVAASMSIYSASAGDEKAVQGADTNGDGVLTNAEVMTVATAKFDALDKNGDGTLTLSELPKQMPMGEMRAKRIAKMKEHRANNPEKAAEFKARREESRMRRQSRMAFIARIDANGDEQVSREEFMAPVERRFAHADADGDGEVTAEERKKAHKKMRKHRKKRHQKS